MTHPNCRARAAAAVAAAGLLVAAVVATAVPAAAETSPYLQNTVPTQGASGTGVFDTQTLYAYLRAGETLTADAGALTGNENPTDTYTIGLGEARVTVTDPAGALLADKSGMSLFDAGKPSDVGPVVVTAATEGVYAVTVGPRLPRYANGSRPWKVDVTDGATAKPGRVFVTNYQMGQPTRAFNQNIGFWAVSEQGYQHKVDLDRYNGWSSNIAANAYGNVDRATCQPTYASDLRNLATVAADAAKCGGSFLLFFDAPSADLPEQAAVAPATALGNGAASHWVLPKLVSPTVQDLAFTPDGVQPRSGELTYDVGNHEGTYTIHIDADGDGSYDGPLDRHVPANSALGLGSYAFDGLDAAGGVVAGTTSVGFRIEVTKAAEIHLVLFDVETMGGGVRLTRLNGEGIADDRLYWDDSMFASYPVCSPKPAVISSLPDGVPAADGAKRGWVSTNNACNDNGTPQNGTWGNEKSLDTWTYGKANVAAETRYGGTAAFTLAKSTTNGDAFVAGDAVDYRFTVKNTGTTDLTNVVLDDPLLGLTGFVCVATLPIGASASCDAPAGYVTTDDDAKAQTVRNTATADATAGPGADAPPTQTAFVDVTVSAKPVAGIELTKHADVTSVTAGGAVSYSFTVRNTGETVLTDVVIDDPLLGVHGLVCAASLPVGASADCDAPAAYTTTAADAAAGSVKNTATATSGPVSDEASVTVAVTPAVVQPTETPTPSDSPSVSPTAPPVLSTTGASPTGGLVGVGLAVLALGTAVVIARRRASA